MATGSVLLVAALKLMGIGMGVVYLMLGVMVLAIKLLTWSLGYKQVEIISQVAPPCVGGAVTPATIAAIGAAIHRYQHDLSSAAVVPHNGKEEK